MRDPLHVDKRNAHICLRLDRPARRNALSPELISALRSELQAYWEDSERHVAILTGSGSTFCAGLDLGEVASLQRDSGRMSTYCEAFLDLLRSIERSHKPIIAAVNGSAVAGGAALMATCDVVVASQSSQVGYPQIRHGLVAPVVMPSLILQVGARRAKYLLLTGEMLTAEAACQFGLIDEVVDDDALMERAEAMAQALGGFETQSISDTKLAFGKLQGLRSGTLDESVGDLLTRIDISARGREFLERFRT